jgi:hypothetical protein
MYRSTNRCKERVWYECTEAEHVNECEFHKESKSLGIFCKYQSGNVCTCRAAKLASGFKRSKG